MPEAAEAMPAGDGHPALRMSVDQRRQQLLDAGALAFARGGYHGTSTDAVAQVAGVSQPYVIRIFGTKLGLFLEVMARATDRIRLALEAVLDEGLFDPDSEEDAARLRTAYNQLSVRDLRLVLMHGFSASDVDAIAEQSRAGLAEILRTIRRTGWSPARCREFIAHGMLVSVLFSMPAPEHVGESSGA